MPVLAVTDEQVIELVKELPDTKQEELLKILLTQPWASPRPKTPDETGAKSDSEASECCQTDTDEVELLSDKGIDYTHLRDLLAAGKWREADEETAKKMLEMTGRTEEGYLETEDIDNFPCEDLRTIDRLWVKYSDDRFGFSVQARIYSELGGTKEYDYEIWKAFGDRVGWRREGEWLLESLTYNYKKKAAAAHFPRLIGFDSVCGEFWPIEARVSLARRLVACSIA